MMTALRSQQLLSGVNATARKVYAAVPIAEAWTAQQIHQELGRQGLPLTWRAAIGCLMHLKDVGLIAEPREGLLQRAPVKDQPAPRARCVDVPRAAAAPQQTPDSPMPSTTTVPPAPAPASSAVAPSSMDKVGAIAARVRRLSTDAAAIAADLEGLAIEIGEHEQANADALERLTTLRKLLREV